jgi:DNA polymerase
MSDVMVERIKRKLPPDVYEKVMFEIQKEDQLPNEIRACTACPLHKDCTQKVPGVGPINADIMFVGEAPGANEDEQGLPFVGKAGQELDRMLAALGWNRNDFYITNTIKCRPPENRTPQKAEVAACYQHLKSEIEMVKPKVVICWGSLAANTLIHPDFKITNELGHWFENNDGIRHIAAFHPSYILRLGDKTEQQKRAKWAVWQAMKKVEAYRDNGFTDHLAQ